ncbi:uncharacterized protein JCM10292_004432 [Rhodotorula paludigena]|uniref:uncharacterized protein n=1 Tax=Rhodotorula paludigena TaxID=86838 RepID=UPI003171DAC2
MSHLALSHSPSHPPSSRPSSRSSLTASTVRPSSAGSAPRPGYASSSPYRGLASPADDDSFDDDDDGHSSDLHSTRTPQPASTHFVGAATDYTYSTPPTPVARRISQPRLPPLPINSPFELPNDTFRNRPLSVASTISRAPRPPSIVMTPPVADRAYVRQPRSSRPLHRYDDSSSDEDPRPRSGLMPRSALANYFNLDFSFLEEEPPARKSAYGTTRKAQADPRRSELSVGTSRSRPGEGYFDLKRMAVTLPAGSSRDSFASTSSAVSALPFPSRRPGNPRRVSSESFISRRSSVVSPGERPYPSTDLAGDVRRPSMASFMSADSMASSGSSLAYGSHRSPTSPTFPPIPEAGPAAAEKRKRLAAFLDETASAMEGGKSLTMVLPESQQTAPQHKSLSELAEEHLVSARPTSSGSNRELNYRSPFGGRSATPIIEEDAPSPTAPAKSAFASSDDEPVSPTSGVPAIAVPPVDTVEQLESDTGEQLRTDLQEVQPEGEESADDEASQGGGGFTLAEALALDRPASGLGLHNVNTKAPSFKPVVERSPSTIRPDSPASLVNSPQPSFANDSTSTFDRTTKALEKRRRIIRELVETETSYAIDMAVVRDIYLARARGAHMAQIADHVMSTGLGLGNVGSASPPSPSLGPRRASHMPESARRTSHMSDSPRRPSAASSSSRLADRRPTVVPSLPNLMPGQPLMSEKDLHVVFANLEEIAALAEGFATALDNASGSDEPEAVDDRIGEIFVEMIPRLQQVYSTYCARHHRAILRLQELEPTLRTYFSECKTLSHGRTNAWDLASLLIKPVQRCLKYPLLLDQILALTPDDHPDRVSLQRANTDMLMVAEHINEHKKRNDAVSRIVNKDKTSQRRDSSRSISSTVTKKLLRSSQKAKSALGFAENGGDEMFDTLVALVDSTRSGVLRFSNEMRDWTKSTKAALESQVNMVEGWINMYAPMAGERRQSPAGASHHRLCVFLDEVLIPIIEGPWRELDHEVRRSLILKTDHLLSLFESPRQVIAKRNDKMLDHSRYLAKKLPSDRRGSEDFLLLSSQLLEELPRFLGSVSRYFNIIVGHFAGAQAAYHESVQERWNAFAEQWLVQVADGSYADIEASFSAQHQPMNQMMETLAAGLGLAVAQSSASSPLNRSRASRLSHMSTASSPVSSGHLSQPVTPDEQRALKRQSFMSNATDYSSDHRNRGSLGSTHRSSVTSDSSAPSLRPSSADGSGSSKAEPITPPPMHTHFSPSSYVKRPRSPHTPLVHHEPLGGHDRRSMALRYDQPLPLPPARKSYQGENGDAVASNGGDMGRSGRTESRTRSRADSLGRSAEELREKYLSTYSVYLPSAEDGFDEDEEFGDGPLYVAEAVNPSRSGAFRSGYPILGCEVGERVDVELEEADRVEGGSGWLLGRKVGGDGRLGWFRTEDFVMVDDEGGEEEDTGSS